MLQAKCQWVVVQSRRTSCKYAGRLISMSNTASIYGGHKSNVTLLSCVHLYVPAKHPDPQAIRLRSLQALANHGLHRICPAIHLDTVEFQQEIKDVIIEEMTDYAVESILEAIERGRPCGT